MLFSSIPFLYLFMPITVFLYLVTPKKAKNFVLLCSSLVFYAWGEPKYVLSMAFMIGQGYVFGLLIEKMRDSKWSKVFLTTSILLSFGQLAYFKYVNFFLESFSKITGLSVPVLQIALPLGISFYTFQIVSYVADVYRKDAEAQRNLIDFAAYGTMFPQLIAGPIVRYSDIAAQLKDRTHSLSQISEGISRFVIGLSKKTLLANPLGEFVSVFKASDEKSVAFYWGYAICYTLHIYFDFSGYSDMAIGLGKLFGFTFGENFNYPYISASITEFWRRWHISLGTWFRDYLYIPLGGNRVSGKRFALNILVVWAATGFWHGAEYTFILWGLMYAVLLWVEKKCLLPALKKHKALSHIYVLFFVVLGFVLFDAADVREAGTAFAAMFGFGKLPAVTATTLYYLRSYAVIILTAMIAATPLFKQIVKKIKGTGVGEKCCEGLEPAVLLLLLAVCTAYLVDGSFNPFLYFRF